MSKRAKLIAQIEIRKTDNSKFVINDRLTLPINIRTFNKKLKEKYGANAYTVLKMVDGYMFEHSFNNLSLVEINRVARAINRFSIVNHAPLADEVVKQLLTLPGIRGKRTNVNNLVHCFNHATKAHNRYDLPKKDYLFLWFNRSKYVKKGVYVIEKRDKYVLANMY